MWFAYFRVINFNRLGNSFFLKLSYYISAVLKKAIFITSPLALSIEPINVCNLKCPECPTGLGVLTRAKGQIEFSKFQKILDNLSSSVWHLNLYFQGEPFMHAQFCSLVKYARDAKKMVVSTSTNAQYITAQLADKIVDSGLDLLTVSFDGASQEVYEKYRINGSFDKVLDAVRYLKMAKEKKGSRYPLITAQFLVFKHNEHQIDAFSQIAYQLGVDKIDIKTAQLYPSDEISDRLTSYNHLSRYQLKNDGQVELKGQYKYRCWKSWSSNVVTWDGKMLPCCFDKNADHVIGNLNSENLKTLTHKKDFSIFRNTLLNRQEEIDICKNCPLSRN